MSEMIDLVNSDGEVVRRGILRDDAKKYEGLHMQIVIAVITNSLGHILVHERAAIKTINGGDIDHVCGAILSGETPEDAAAREAREEVGLEPTGLQVIRRGVNSYNRYCYLVRGSSDETPADDLDSSEVAWAAFHPVDVLHAKRDAGDFTFVDGFFEDLNHALEAPA